MHAEFVLHLALHRLAYLRDHTPGDDSPDDGGVTLHLHPRILNLELVGAHTGKRSPELFDLVRRESWEHTSYAIQIARHECIPVTQQRGENCIGIRRCNGGCDFSGEIRSTL